MHFRPSLRTSLLVTSAALLLTASPAFADTVTIFDYNATFSGYAGSGTETGTITIDTTVGTVLSGSVTASGFTGSNGLETLFSRDSRPDDIYLLQFDGPGFTELELTVDTFVGYAGGPILTESSSVFALDSGNGGYSFATSGSLTPEISPAPTPEPSTFALLGTGLLSAAGMGRKRRHA
jgi:type 1 fimbria pilin